MIRKHLKCLINKLIRYFIKKDKLCPNITQKDPIPPLSPLVTVKSTSQKYVSINR